MSDTLGRLRRAAITLFALAAAAACAPTFAGLEPDLSGPPLEKLYADAALQIKAEGGLRTERDPTDAPLTQQQLARNFSRIAFFSEYAEVNGREVARQSAITLTRWEDPVRLGLLFGASVSSDQRSKDIADVQALLERVRSATGLDIRYRPSGEINFFVLVMNRGEQLGFAIEVENGDQLPASLADDLRNSRPSVFCSARLYSNESDGDGLVGAVALIKSEHRAVMRTSCFHEELVQALGLLNDDFRVRPSIFNDDEEFALLTRHDEALLAMLYDRRLRAGMTLDQAAPFLDTIAADAAAKVGLRLSP